MTTTHTPKAKVSRTAVSSNVSTAPSGLKATMQRCIAGIRFYIALAIGLITLETWWWAASQFAGSNLFSIRIEEVYAWMSLGFLALALLIGPLYHIFSVLPGRKIAYDARRLLGIGAAWFATLHVTIAYVSLFKLANPLHVPGTYRTSFLLGAVALVILLAMAFTSFNAAFNRMGKWWFRLHRFVYLAGALALLHAFTIGTHAATLPVLIVLGVLSFTILGMHCFIVVRQPTRMTNWQILTIGTMVSLLVAVFNYGYQQRNQYQGTTSVRQGSDNASAY